MIYPFSAFILKQLQEALGYFIIGCLHDAFDNDNSSKKNSVRKMLIQVFNAGSSSIKFALYQHQSKLELLKGNLEKIGEASSILSFQTSSSPSQKIELSDGCQNHKEGIQKILEIFVQEKNNPGSADLIVHRVVHGGTKYRHAALLDLEVKQFIRDMIPLARTHHPASLACIEEISEHFPGIPQSVVFDTSFHQTLPEYAWRYALPRKISDQYAIRRYGFHGISHQSVVKQAASFLETPVNKLNLITIHLGNGASISAIKKGICVDTTMGMTPLEGLVMGTRPGDLDPGILTLLAREGWNQEALETMLNQDSGMKGLCGTNDFREILQNKEEGNEEAEMALELYCYRVRKTIGSFSTVIGPVDALVFTGGVGENVPWVREHSVRGMEWRNIQLAPDMNDHAEAPCAIHSKNSQTKILVLPSDEEWEMASQAAELIL